MGETATKLSEADRDTRELCITLCRSYRIQALREVLEWIKEEERDCGAFGSINADGLKTKIKRSINE